MTLDPKIAQEIADKNLWWKGVLHLSGEAIILPDVQQWLRIEHDIHIVIDREGLDSDEMCYVYEVTYLKPEDQDAKHWVGKLTRVRSFDGVGTTYWGGWDKYEQALQAAIEFALTLIPKA